MTIKPLPALHLHRPPLSSEPVGRLGGKPQLAIYQEWPFNQQGKPLSFLGELNLAALNAIQPLPDWMPTQGRLVLFYDSERQPGGTPPGQWQESEKTGWRLWFVPDDAQACAVPEGVTLAPEVPLGAEATTSLPSPHREGSSTSMEVWEQYLLDLPVVRHQFLGYPVPIQDDVGEQWAARRVAATSPSDKTVSGGLPGDWTLLWQVDSDGAMDWMWGDSGTLHVFVQPERVRRGEWAHAEVVLDCY